LTALSFGHRCLKDFSAKGNEITAAERRPERFRAKWIPVQGSEFSKSMPSGLTRGHASLENAFEENASKQKDRARL
jgi:hypothetical protein